MLKINEVVFFYVGNAVVQYSPDRPLSRRRTFLGGRKRCFPLETRNIYNITNVRRALWLARRNRKRKEPSVTV